MGTDGLGIWVSAGAAITGIGVTLLLVEHPSLWSMVAGWSLVGIGIVVATAAIGSWVHSNRDILIRRTIRRVVSVFRSFWLIPVDRVARKIYDRTHAADLWAGPGQTPNDDQRLAYHLSRLQHDARFSLIKMYGRRLPERLFIRIPSAVHALSSIQMVGSSAHLADVDGQSRRFEYTDVSMSPIDQVRSCLRLRKIILHSPYNAPQ